MSLVSTLTSRVTGPKCIPHNPHGDYIHTLLTQHSEEILGCYNWSIFCLKILELLGWEFDVLTIYFLNKKPDHCALEF